MLVVLAALAAAVLGLLAPRALARVPEPADPEPGKTRYADLAAVPHLGAALATGAGALTALVGVLVEPAALVVVWVLLAPVGILLAYVDARTRLLPRLVVLPLNAGVLALLLLVAVIERDLGLLGRAAAGGAGLFVVLATLWLVAPGSLGYGDVRLSLALGMVLAASGWTELLVGVYAAFVLAAVLGVVLGRRGRIDPRRFAFGPFLVAGAVVGVLWPPLVPGA